MEDLKKNIADPVAEESPGSLPEAEEVTENETYTVESEAPVPVEAEQEELHDDIIDLCEDFNENTEATEEVPAAEPVFTPAPAVEKPARFRLFHWKLILAFGVILAIVLASVCLTANYLNTKWQTQLNEINQEHDTEIAALENNISQMGGGYGVSVPTGALTPSQVYNKNVDAVVSVACEVGGSGYLGGSVGVSSGSGFIITADGYILTNAHVVDGATAIEVMTHDGQTYTATLAGADTVNDVALLKIDASDLPHVTLGSSTKLAVGDQVAAIGNALGTLSSTMTVGYVSAKDRVVNTDGSTLNMIQTDAAINSGNSGGPLFNMDGEVVGITTAKYSGTTNSGATIEGIGFAIPIDDIQDILTQLKGQGYVSSAYLGVTVMDVSEEAQYYGLPAGASVESVDAGHSAANAGIQPRDIITKLGDYDISSTNDLILTLRKFKAGETTTITVYRSGRYITLNITLEEKPRS